MELENFRRTWQQVAPAEAQPALDTVALERLLARRSSSPVAKMRRNVWLEIGFAVLGLIASGMMLVYTSTDHNRAMAAWVGLICLISCVYYRRKVAVLHSLNDANGPLREQVERQLSNLRSLTKLYYQATMWTLPVSFGIGFLFPVVRIQQDPEGQYQLLLWGGLLLIGALTFFLGYVFLRYFTRWYIQRLYGQHLDRLEAILRDLQPGT